MFEALAFTFPTKGFDQERANDLQKLDKLLHGLSS